MNYRTLVAVCGYGPTAPPSKDWAHDLKGDAFEIEAMLPFYEHHKCPVIILSPKDAPIKTMGPHICRHAGVRGYIGQVTLDRQRDYLKILLSYPSKWEWFLLHDSDSVCFTPEIPGYLYEDKNIIWSNELDEPRPHLSVLPKIAMQPPYFFSREALVLMLSVSDRIKAHPITPYVDHYMLQLACEAKLKHRNYVKGTVTMLHPVKGVRAPDGTLVLYDIRDGKTGVPVSVAVKGLSNLDNL